MRKLGIAVGVIVLIIVVAILVFAATFNVNRYRGTIQSELQKQLGRPVTLGEMHLGLFPPRVRVQNLSVADDPSFNAQKPFVQAAELDVSVRLLPLLKKQVEIRSLDLDRPVVELIRNKQGAWNFDSLGKQASNSQATPEPQPTKQQQQQSASEQPSAQQGSGAQSTSAQKQSSNTEQFSLGRLTIRDGQLSVTDQKTSPTPSIYDHIDAELKNFSPGQPFALNVSARLPGAGSPEMRLSGNGGPLVQGQPAQTPFHGTLALRDVSIAGLSKFVNSQALEGMDGTVNGTTQLDSHSGKISANGETTVQNAKIKGADLGYPIDARYDITDELPTDLITIRNLVVKLGSTPLQVSGTVNQKATPAQLDLALNAKDVGFAEIARLAALSGKPLPPGLNATGTINANVQAKGAADKPALNGIISTTPLQISGKDIPQPVQVQPVDLHLTPTQIQSNAFNISSAGATVNTQFTLHNYVSPTPIVDATVKAPNAQLPAILEMARLYGVQGADKVNGSGVVSLDMHASGPVKSLNAQELMKTLNGTASLNLNNVKYTGADVGHELSSIAGVLGSSSLTKGLSQLQGSAAQDAAQLQSKGAPAAKGLSSAEQGVTNIQSVTGNIQVKNGVAQTNNLQAQTDFGKIGAVGSANLADETLNLRADAVLSPSASKTVGGTNVGGMAKTALANNQGELVIPATITGTFSQPKFAPDFQQVAQMKMKNLLPNSDNPGALLGTVQKLTGGGIPGVQTQQSQQGQQGQQPSQTQKAVQQVMGLFGGKKK